MFKVQMDNERGKKSRFELWSIGGQYLRWYSVENVPIIEKHGRSARPCSCGDRYEPL